MRCHICAWPASTHLFLLSSRHVNVNTLTKSASGCARLSCTSNLDPFCFFTLRSCIHLTGTMLCQQLATLSMGGKLTCEKISALFSQNVISRFQRCHNGPHSHRGHSQKDLEDPTGKSLSNKRTKLQKEQEEQR